MLPGGLSLKIWLSGFPGTCKGFTRFQPNMKVFLYQAAGITKTDSDFCNPHI